MPSLYASNSQIYITNPGIGHKLCTYSLNMSKTKLLILHSKFALPMDGHPAWSIPVLVV